MDSRVCRACCEGYLKLATPGAEWVNPQVRHVPTHTLPSSVGAQGESAARRGKGKQGVGPTPAASYRSQAGPPTRQGVHWEKGDTPCSAHMCYHLPDRGTEATWFPSHITQDEGLQVVMRPTGCRQGKNSTEGTCLQSTPAVTLKYDL